mmetsp:Transcript_92992/g.277584  ORF Transcript_92992/g.277584 Transcript_92992/m.277584 type:complete len:208 (+) Transcript_92992:427-1050(+)
MAGASSACTMAARTVREERCLAANPKAQSLAACDPGRLSVPLASSTPPAKRHRRREVSKGKAPACSAERPNASSAAGTGSQEALIVASLFSPCRSEASGMPSGSKAESTATVSARRCLAAAGSRSRTLGKESATMCAIRCSSSRGTGDDSEGDDSSSACFAAALSACSHAVQRARMATTSSKSCPRRKAWTLLSRRMTSSVTACLSF